MVNYKQIYLWIMSGLFLPRLGPEYVANEHVIRTKLGTYSCAYCNTVIQLLVKYILSLYLNIVQTEIL